MLLLAGAAPTPATPPLGSAIEDQLTQGKAPSGLAPPIADPHDLEGVWLPFNAGGPAGPPPSAGNDPHPTVAGGLPPPPDMGVFNGNENAPWSAQMCAPMPVFGAGFNLEIVQGGSEVLLIGEDAQFARIIRLGGFHPKQTAYSRNGDSIGHWDGDTLVVDTTGLGAQGNVPSRAYVVERIYKTDGGDTLHIDSVQNQPGHAPIAGHLTARWRPDLHLAESVCEEGFSHFQLKNGKLVIDYNAGK